MAVSTELNRIIRHSIAPLVIIAVDRGWIPAGAEDSIIELATILVAIAIPYGISLWRDMKKET